ncbi:MAG: hypothetical protein U0872_11450 [Planctomycetaceae bacterium]
MPSSAGRPPVGESISWKQLKFTVLTADRRKINRLEQELIPEGVLASPKARSPDGRTCRDTMRRPS